MQELPLIWSVRCRTKAIKLLKVDFNNPLSFTLNKEVNCFESFVLWIPWASKLKIQSSFKPIFVHKRIIFVLAFSSIYFLNKFYPFHFNWKSLCYQLILQLTFQLTQKQYILIDMNYIIPYPKIIYFGQ